MRSGDRWGPTQEVCATCDGVLRLQARWTRLQAAGDEYRGGLDRLEAEARWFLLALERVQPCPSHAGCSRLARHLAGDLATVDPFRAALEECQR